MKIKNICLTVLLLCSCHQTIDSLPSGTSKEIIRHDEIRRIMRENYIHDLENDAYWLTADEHYELLRLKKDFNADLRDSDSVLALMTPGPGWEIRGPLSIDRFKVEMIEMYEESLKIRNEVYDINRKFEDSETGEEFARFNGQYQKGDEIYFFKSDERSWAYLCGTEGYILIRKNKIIDGFVTAIN